MPIWSIEIKDLETLFTSIKGQFPELEKELEQLIKTEDPNVVMLYSRRCLEVIITDLCESELKRPRKTEPLKGIIDKLNREEKVPAHIITSMHSLNSLSTYGAHPKEFDPEQVKPVLSNLTIILKWYLKYKEIQATGKPEAEGVKDEIKPRVDSAEHIPKPKKRLILFLSGIALIVVIAVVALFMFNIIGGGKQIRELEKSIAVLPFENWNSDEEYAHMGDAIANEIITQLSNINEFHVFSYTSTSQFKGSDKPSIPEIGEKLGANFIIEGAVERQKEDVSIHVQVIQAESDDHLWAEEFKGKWEDIFTIRVEMTMRIAEELKVVLSTEEIEQIDKKPTENIEAYNLYLLGKFCFSQYDDKKIMESIKYFNSAIDLDSNLALAYVGLAQSYQILVRHSYLPRDEGYVKAKRAVSKAIELNATLGEAYANLASIMAEFDWDFYSAGQEFQKAIKMNPNSSEIYSSYALYLLWMGRLNESINTIKRAIELDPLVPVTNGWLGAIYFYADRYDESIDHFNKMLALFSDFNDYPYAYLAYNYALKGFRPEAIYYADKALSYTDTSDITFCHLGWVYALSGEISKAKEILTKLQELNMRQTVDPFQFAVVYSGLGEYDKTIDWLLKAYEVRSGMMVSLNIYSNSFFKNISSDPRYIDLMKKVGFEVD
jgi:TolB-like protein/Tfp pilus assembly protein PilF